MEAEPLSNPCELRVPLSSRPSPPEVLLLVRDGGSLAIEPGAEQCEGDRVAWIPASRISPPGVHGRCEAPYVCTRCTWIT